MAQVQVYGGRQPNFLTDVGQAVSPSAINPIDFSTIDEAVKIEHDIDAEIVGIMEANLEAMAKLRDELTGYEFSSMEQMDALNVAKQRHGINEAAYARAANNLDNPMAMYDLDRRMKRLASDVTVKEALRQEEYLRKYRAEIFKIPDLNLRAKAIADYNKAVEHQQDDKGKWWGINDLEIGNYQSIDPQATYKEMLIKGGGVIPQQSLDPSTGTITTRYELVPGSISNIRQMARSLPYFMNNIEAMGFNDVDRFFSEIEASISNLQTTEQKYAPRSSGTADVSTGPNVTTDPNNSGDGYGNNISSAEQELIQSTGTNAGQVQKADVSLQNQVELSGINWEE